ncbi:MAG: glycosyl hydrolase 108 family protein [Hyphomicrobium sp.]
MSAREALQPLELAYFFDSVESGDKIAFRHRGQSAWPVAGRRRGPVRLCKQGARAHALFDADRLLGFRWPSSGIAIEPAPRADDDLVFMRALAHVLEMEGGYSDDPFDPGGPTNRGITLATFAAWRGETLDASSRARLIDVLKRIPDDVVAAIYRKKYWQAASCEALPAALALMHFDAAVNHGVGGAIRLLQGAVGTDVDGEIGPQTRAAIARTPIIETLKRYADARRARYRALPHFWRFGRGWLRRVDATQKLAAAWLADRKFNTAEGEDGMATIKVTPENVGKWWIKSRTIWGAIISAAAAILPALGPVIGVDLPADVIKDAGDQTVTAVQAVAGLIGTLLTIYGRIAATVPLIRQPFNVRL